MADKVSVNDGRAELSSFASNIVKNLAGRTDRWTRYVVVKLFIFITLSRRIGKILLVSAIREALQ